MKFRFTVCHQAVVSVLRETREAAGISQRELSARLKRAHNYANLVENQQRLQNVCEFFAYVHAIGADPVDVVRRIEELQQRRRKR